MRGQRVPLTFCLSPVCDGSVHLIKLSLSLFYACISFNCWTVPFKLSPFFWLCQGPCPASSLFPALRQHAPHKFSLHGHKSGLHSDNTCSNDSCSEYALFHNTTNSTQLMGLTVINEDTLMSMNFRKVIGERRSRV